jgi:hypothetical protein
MPRTNITGSSPGFVVDYNGASRSNGKQIDWDKLDDSFRQTKQIVKANGAAAAGATSITVDALPVDVPLGTILNFGTFAPVTVTTSGVAAAAATSIPVNALSAPLPSGTILDFTGSGEFALLTAAAAAGATSLTVQALDAEIESGDTATFQGGTKQARLTAAAAKGAASISVDELQFIVADNSEATFGGTGSKKVAASTIMAELPSGKIIPRKSVTGSETATEILISDADEGAKEHAATGYGTFLSGTFYEDLMADRNETDFATWIGEIRTNGGSVRLQPYSDSRAS